MDIVATFDKEKQFSGQWGVELPYGLSIYDAQEFIKRDLVKHFQITIPNNYSFCEVFDYSSELNIIIHSNIADFFNGLDQDDIKVGKNIRSLKTKYLIEHASMREFNNQKYAYFIPEDINDSNRLNKFCDEIFRWQDVTSKVVLVENVQVVTNAEDYLDFLLSVASKGIGLTIDISHLLISANASGMSFEEALSFIDAVGAKHFHVSGLKIINGHVVDDHRSYSRVVHRVLTYIKEKVKNPVFTLEQDSNCSIKKTVDLLNLYKSVWHGEFDSIAGKPSFSDETSNQYYRQVATKYVDKLCIKKDANYHDIMLVDEMVLNFFDRKFPFIYPNKVINGLIVDGLVNDEIFYKIKKYGTWLERSTV